MKGASETQVVLAAQRTEARLEAAQRAMSKAGRNEPSQGEIASGERAMARGATEAQLETVVQHTPSDRSLVVALDADSKLIPCWRVGKRGAQTTVDFMLDLKSRLRNRVQITTDGHRVYLDAVENAFGADIDYAQLQKIYGAVVENETRYSPAKCIGCDMKVVSGNPDPKHVSTSYVERQNLTMRMHMRRFTRLTNGFSKKVDNHRHSVALHYMFYNFCRIHQTLKVTPAMEAGVTDHVWNIEELCALLPKPTVSSSKIEKKLIAKALSTR